MYTEFPLQSVIAAQPRQPEREVSNSLLNRFAGFGVQRPIQTLRAPVRADDPDLDRRVRESGEW